MKILARILALFLIMPMVELALLLKIGDLIGFWPTIGIIIFTGVLGGFLAKREGLAVWQQFNRRVQSGGLPGRELIDGVIILCAGALLITPGVLTDLLGFVGLVPFTRALVRKEVMRRVKKAMQKGTVQMGFGGFGQVPVDRPEAEHRNGAGWQGSSRPTPGYTEERGPGTQQERTEGPL